MTVETLRLSYSSKGTLKGCERKFEFDKLYPQPRQRLSGYAAEVGTALHAGYQDFLIHGDEEHAIFEFMLKFPYELEFEQENDYRSFEASLMTLEAMMHSNILGEYELAQIRRPNTPEELAAGESGGRVVPAIEVPFEIHLAGLTVPYRVLDASGHRTGEIVERPVSIIGYADALMFHRVTGAYKTLDIKTHRDTVRDRTAEFKFNTQQVPYGLVLSQISEGMVEQFNVLYFDCYVDLLDPRIREYEFTKTAEDIQEWCLKTVLDIGRLRQMMAMDFFPRTEHGCMFYRSPCRYLDVCESRDHAAITDFLLMGQEPVDDKQPFFPWISVTIQADQ